MPQRILIPLLGFCLFFLGTLYIYSLFHAGEPSQAGMNNSVIELSRNHTILGATSLSSQSKASNLENVSIEFKAVKTKQSQSHNKGKTSLGFHLPDTRVNKLDNDYFTDVSQRSGQQLSKELSDNEPVMLTVPTVDDSAFNLQELAAESPDYININIELSPISAISDDVQLSMEEAEKQRQELQNNEPQEFIDSQGGESNNLQKFLGESPYFLVDRNPLVEVTNENFELTTPHDSEKLREIILVNEPPNLSSSFVEIID